MVTITLIILIPIIAVIVGLLVLKAYTLGLTHSYDLKHDIKPVDEVKQFFNTKQPIEEEQVSIMNEWLNGKEGE